MIMAIILIGPQGSGKTTLAKFIVKKFLSKGFNPCVIKLIDYTIFHHIYLKMLGELTKRSDSREVFIRLFPLYILIHFIGLVISLTKLLSYMVFNRCRIYIEDEGFIFKEIADLYFLAGVSEAIEDRLDKRLLKQFLKFLFRIFEKMSKSCIIIYVDAPYEILVHRYIIRKQIENRSYIDFQRFLYKLIIYRMSKYISSQNEYQYVYIENVDKTAKISTLNLITRILDSLL